MVYSNGTCIVLIDGKDNVCTCIDKLNLKKGLNDCGSLKEVVKKLNDLGFEFHVLLKLFKYLGIDILYTNKGIYLKISGIIVKLDYSEKDGNYNCRYMYDIIHTVNECSDGIFNSKYNRYFCKDLDNGSLICITTDIISDTTYIDLLDFKKGDYIDYIVILDDGFYGVYLDGNKVMLDI